MRNRLHERSPIAVSVVFIALAMCGCDMTIPPLWCMNHDYPRTQTPAPFPGSEWQQVDDVGNFGWDAGKLDDAYAFFDEYDMASLMIVDDGRLIGARGCTTDRWYVASIRKSFMSATYGKYVDAGEIDLSASLADLGIEENNTTLTPQQQAATVGHVLVSSTGVCLAAAASGQRDCTLGQEVPPGQKFEYNNWDFNVADTIFSKSTGRDFYDAFAEDLAYPIAMEDFDGERDRSPQQIAESQHRAYHVDMSARDMARFGLLILRGGMWNGQRVIPASWVETSTRTHLPTTLEKTPGGYGYYWWIHDGQQFASYGLTQPFFYASGAFGQKIFVFPEAELVVVMRGNLIRQKFFTGHLSDATLLALLGKIVQAHNASNASAGAS